MLWRLLLLLPLPSCGGFFNFSHILSIAYLKLLLLISKEGVNSGAPEHFKHTQFTISYFDDSQFD